MAEAFVSCLSGGKVSVASAGTYPSAHVSPVVIEAMKEKAIDISCNSRRRSRMRWSGGHHVS